MGADDKTTTTHEVELQRLMPDESQSTDTEWHSSDQDEDALGGQAYSKAIRQRHQIPAWKKVLYSMPLFRRSSPRRQNIAAEDASNATKFSTVLSRRRSITCIILCAFFSLILFISAVLIFNEFAGIHQASYTPPWSTPHWLDSNFVYPRLFLRNVTALPCISHNDEARSVPLFEALANGCTGVEADIYLRYGDQVLVGHRRRELNIDRTVGNMYISPLAQVVTRIKRVAAPEAGIFDTNRKQPIVLMFDFKEENDVDRLFRALEVELEPLRKLKVLSHVKNGKFVQSIITVVVSGAAPFRMIQTSKYHDIFFDAPLRWIWKDRTMGQGGDASSTSQARAGSGQGYGETEDVDNAHEFSNLNSYFASTSFAHLYWPPMFGLSKTQRKEIKEQVEAAHAQGLKVRYWGTYDWPWTRIRERLWRYFDITGVDIWNVDDLAWFGKGLWRNKDIDRL